MAKADRKTGEVKFRFEDEDYTLVFDWPAIEWFERVADVSIVDALAQLEARGTPKVSLLGRIMQAGLLKHHPEIEPIPAFNMAADQAVQDALGVAVQAASPDPRKAPTKATKAKPRSTSKRHSNSRSKRG